MNELGSIAVIVTAVAALITAVGGFILAMKVLVPTHKLVNQQRTDMLRFQGALIKTLELHGIAIPEDQSKLSP